MNPQQLSKLQMKVRILVLNPEKIRADFPIYNRKIHGQEIIYLDSACMSLKPKQVIESINKYYNEMPACAGRSGHTLGNEVTRAISNSRKTVQKFLNAKNEKEIIFTRNTTEGINLVANSFNLKKGDKIITSDKEHNSGFLPFQKLSKKGLTHEIFEFGNIEDFKTKVRGTKLVSFVHTSNLDGTTQNAKELIKIAHEEGAKVLIDGAQSTPHKKIDVRKLDVDFLCFSGHKLLGPTGTGVLFGKEQLLEEMEQFLVGGETVKNSTYTTTDLEDLPHKFEAGLQDYAGLIGLGEAINYIEKIGLDNIENHEKELNKIITNGFDELGIEIISREKERSGIVSFNIKGMHNHEVAGILNESANIMIRSGMHCCHPWFNKRKMEGSARVSLYLYNTKEECEKLLQEVENLTKMI